MKFDTVPERNRIDDKVIVIVACVTVSGYHHFQAISPQLLCQLDADLMGNLRCDFSLLKRLIPVVAGAAPQLIPARYALP